MDSTRPDDARRKAAAENLAKRKSELRKDKNKMRGRILLASGVMLAILTVFGVAKLIMSAVDGIGDSDRIVIGLKGSQIQIVKQGDPYIENGAFAVDRKNGAIDSSSIKIKGKVKSGKPGEYEIVYKVKSNGARAKVKRTVYVIPEEEYGKEAANVPVMMYHWVYTADDPPQEPGGNWILDTELDKQMAYLKEENYYFPGWKELRAWVDGEISLPAKSIVITFDDGKQDFLKYGIPVLEKNQVPATTFMICSEKSKGAEKVKKFASPYVDFENHSYKMHTGGNAEGHKGIAATMTKEAIMEDLAKASEITGNNDAFAYPYGDYTDDMLEAVREQGIVCAFTTEYDRVRQGMDPVVLPRIRVMGNKGFATWQESL